MPMAGYKDFAACVRANQDKSNPEAYCGSIKHKVEDKKSMREELFYKGGFGIDIQKTPEGKEVWRSVLSSTSIDYDGERMSAKALEMAAGDLMKNTTVFFNHDHKGLGVAKFVNAAVVGGDQIGRESDQKYLVVDMEPSAAKGVEDVVTQVHEGILKCMSIGGKTLKSYSETVKDASDSEKTVRVLDEIKALEGSVVGIGANPDAMMMNVAKSFFIDSLLKDHVPEESDEGHTPLKPMIAAHRKPRIEEESEEDYDAELDMGGGTGKLPVVPTKGKKKLVTGKKSVERRAPRKKEIRCSQCGEMHKIQCPYCGSLEPHPEGPDAPVKSEGDFMTTVKCVNPSCGKEFEIESNLVLAKEEEPEEEEEEEDEPEDEEEEEDKKKKKKKSEDELDTEKEMGPNTPNHPTLDEEADKAGLYAGKAKGKKKGDHSPGRKSGYVENGDMEVDSHGSAERVAKPPAPRKSLEEENLELKTMLTDMKKSMDAIKETLYSRKSLVETKSVVTDEGEDRLASLRKSMFQTMNITDE